MAGPDDTSPSAQLQNGFAAANAQPSGLVGQVCETCPNNWVETGATDEETGQPIPGLGYRVYDLATGDRVASGVLDAEGKSPRHSIPMPATQLYVVYGTEAAMDEAEGKIKEMQRQHALRANARPDWNGIPAGLDEAGFNNAFNQQTMATGRMPPRNVSLLGASAAGWKGIYDMVASGFDVTAARNEFYLDERARSFDEYQLVTGAREASRWESLGGGAGQGVSFGFGEEGMARLESLLSIRSYEESVAARRQMMEAQRLANPGTFIGGEVAGALPTIFLPVGAAANTAVRGGQGVRGAAAAGARTGAGLGAVSGAGHDTGGVLDRLDGAAFGGLTGGLTGALLGGAGVLIARGVSRTRIWGRITGRVPPKRSPFHRKDLSDEWYDSQTGELRWPPNDGFEGTSSIEPLKPGQLIDRYSARTGEADSGTFLSPEGASWGSRALPYDRNTQQYAVYEVIRPFEVQAGRAAGWFDEPGGAIQYMTNQTVGDLVRDGFLKQVR